MKQFVAACIIFLACCIPTSVLAHPLDVSYTDLHLFNDFNNKPLPHNIVVGEVYLAWLQASILVQKSEKIASPEARLLPSYQKPYADYLSRHLVLLNDKKECTSIYGLPPKQPENEILFGRGVMIPVRFECKSNISEMKITNSIFVDEFLAQRNNVNIYNGPELALKGFVLTKQAQSFTTSVAELKNPPPSNAPSGRKLSLLEKLSQGYLDVRTTSLTKAILFVFLMGLLHTLEVGHSKTILSSFLIQNKAKMKDGFMFAGIFTLTHIADIVVLGIVLYITNAFVDVFTRLSYLQTFSFYALLFISAYMLLTNISHYIQHRFLKTIHGHEHRHEIEISAKSIKKQLFLGFLAGLSPCLFGWSIFMVILTTKKIWVIFPIILSFAMGIFVALSIFVIIIIKTKSRIFDRFEWLSEVSPIISSLLLLVFALSAVI